MLHGRRWYHKDNRPERRVYLSSHRVAGEYNKYYNRRVWHKKKRTHTHTHTHTRSCTLGMIGSISFNIPRCCWLPPLEQSLCRGEQLRWAEEGTGAGPGGETPGSASVLLMLLRKARGYLGDNCWQRWGCCCWRCWARSVAGIASVPGCSCFLSVEGGVYLLHLYLQPHPLPGLHTRAWSLSCTVAP